MAATTSRATFLRPEAIVPVMDAITYGWQHRRACRNVAVLRVDRERAIDAIAQRLAVPNRGAGAQRG